MDGVAATATLSNVREPLVVGFDLDMTLFDTRPGVKLVWEQLSAAVGIEVDSDLVVSRLGPPLASEMANWAPPDRINEYVNLYQAMYDDYAIVPTLVMPGALAALAAVKNASGSTMIVTAKHGTHAQLHVDHAAMDVDTVVGGLWGAGKGAALVEHGASVYVGDHVLDVAGAHAAGAVAVAVTTGPCSADELRDAGAAVVLADLTEFPAWFENHVLELRLQSLDTGLRALDGLVVAFSGGADSAFLLAAAVRALGPDRVVAATATSASLPAAELDAARAFAAHLGVRHLTPTTHEMDREGYRANAANRCYFCKAELVEVLSPLAAELGLAVVATGTNADDAVAGFRPGIRAASERGATTPLLDAALTKAQIRQASRQWDLPTWDKPAAACLSSRIAYGIPVTPARLSRVERAEVSLRSVLHDSRLAVSQLRVRDLGDHARIELDSDALAAVLTNEVVTATVLDAVRAVGFAEVALDPAGFRSGSMNELLAVHSGGSPK